ncbi:MAG: hypothetical protein COZ56_15345 [Armatimonadetes bacterium CG_4_8_14_3_um_filter_58_9]|nr:MAG: hypothetical protein COZ56_15345 [Armatimonadetes bacterium CG_4_8_14_3_um_filter_58_9]PJB63210.1 MAG: hypothetical protein CO095_16990 [Armatimonadetes bacterium CG_4_9_14_3_um_filter_58_7]
MSIVHLFSWKNRRIRFPAGLPKILSGSKSAVDSCPPTGSLRGSLEGLTVDPFPNPITCCRYLNPEDYRTKNDGNPY